MSKYKNYEKTKVKIRNAFLKLVLEKKDFDLVGVKDIIVEAKIAKSTFYYHYADLDDYLNELYDDIIEQINIFILTYDEKNNKPKFGYIRQIINHIKEYDDFFRCLFKTEKSLSFINKFKDNLVNLFKEDKNFYHFFNEERLATAEIYFVANGISYLFVDYYQEKLDISLDEITELLCSGVLINPIKKM